MTKLSAILVVLLLSSIGVFAQGGKGIDKGNERVRDTGSRTAGTNGSKTDTGAGRGIDFGGGRTPEVRLLDNPYRLVARRDVIMKAVQDVMRDRGLIMDEAASRVDEGIIVTQPFNFIKGAVVSAAEINRYSNITTTTDRDRGWTRGRYTITVEVQPIDGTSANVSVNAKIEGRTDGATGAEWITLPTSGVAEDEFLAALIENITGGPPAGRATSEN